MKLYVDDFDFFKKNSISTLGEYFGNKGIGVMSYNISITRTIIVQFNIPLKPK